jgi:TetR/AcrR family transcriptional repressor of nem operon
MVQNATAETKKPGRRPSFDRDSVVAAATYVFWEKGFAATTLSDLEAATGVDRSTLYNSFDGKTGIYRAATTAYVSAAEATLFQPLYTGSKGTENIVEFLNQLEDNLCSEDNPRGCLIVNDMASNADTAARTSYLEKLEGGFRAALERASATGEIDGATVSRRIQFLTAAILGINLAHRESVHTASAQGLLSGVRDEVRSWSVVQ